MPLNEGPKYAQYLENYLTTGERRFMGVAREVEGRHKSGHLIPLDITVHESNVDGRLLFTALIRDISERRDSRLLLDLAQGRALQADMARRHFLANMSHALRTPLSGIVGMADLLMETRLQNEQRDYLNSLMDSAQGLLENLDGLMECSREKDDELIGEDFDPRKVLDDLGDLLASRVRARTVEIYLHIHPDLPSRIPGHSIRINQALLHMTTHMLRGINVGSLVIGVAPLEKGRQYGIHFWIKASPCSLDIKMVEALLGRPHTHILDDHNMAEGYFNLHLAHVLAYLMDGSMGVSHDSDGATLSLTIPLALPLEQGLGVSLLAQVRCLILEPKGIAAVAFESLLHGYGCCPQFAEDWQEALAILGTQAADGRPVHLVIMPYSLPDNGAESFLQAVSADPNLAFTRVMVHSPMNRREKALALLAQGAVYCLTHPIKQKRLVELILKMIKDELVSEELEAPRQALFASVQGKVLLVEDNDVNQKLAIKVLEKEQCEYMLAEDGQAAVDAAAREVFDLILMDINLPIMDGIQATRLIRLEGPNRKTPIIAMTADVINVNEQMCRVNKMDGLLFKPIRVYELVGLMRRTFRKAITQDSKKD